VRISTDDNDYLERMRWFFTYRKVAGFQGSFWVNNTN